MSVPIRMLRTCKVKNARGADNKPSGGRQQPLLSKPTKRAYLASEKRFVPPSFLPGPGPVHATEGVERRERLGLDVEDWHCARRHGAHSPCARCHYTCYCLNFLTTGSSRHVAPNSFVSRSTSTSTTTGKHPPGNMMRVVRSRGGVFTYFTKKTTLS